MLISDISCPSARYCKIYLGKNMNEYVNWTNNQEEKIALPFAVQAELYQLYKWANPESSQNLL